MQLPDVFDQEFFGRQVIDRDVKETLDGVGVQVQRDDAVRPGQGDDVGHEFGTDGVARLGLFLLAGIAVIRNHSGDAAGRGTPKGIKDDEELHVIFRDRLAGRLDEKDIGAAHAVRDLDVDLAVGEARDPHLVEGLVERVGDLAGKLRVGVAREKLERARLLGRTLGCLRPHIDSLADPGLRYVESSPFRRPRRRSVQPATIFCSERSIARLPAGTSAVITDPAAVYASSPTLTGATRIVSLPTCARSPISVRCLSMPSKFAVTVPAPMLALAPTSLSSTALKCAIAVPAPMCEFLISAWVPTRTPSSSTLPGRSRLNGPTWTFCASVDRSTCARSIRQASPMIESRICANGPMTQSSPIVDSPEIKLNGRTTVSRPMCTSASINVVAGSVMVTPLVINESRIRWRITRSASAS